MTSKMNSASKITYVSMFLAQSVKKPAQVHYPDNNVGPDIIVGIVKQVGFTFGRSMGIKTY